jgi:hypothetical protein
MRNPNVLFLFIISLVLIPFSGSICLGQSLEHVRQLESLSELPQWFQRKLSPNYS